MNPHSDPKVKTNVILTVDACSYSNNMVELAVAIAASGKIHLHGLFIEDEDLLTVAELPFTREISLTTAQEQPTDTTRMQNSLRALGTQFKTALQRSAQAADVSWSYDYVRGRRDDIALTEERDVRFTILGRTSLHRAETIPRQRTHRILIVEDHSSLIGQILQVLLQRIHADPLEITWLQQGSDLSGQTRSLLEDLQHEHPRMMIHTHKLDDLESILSSRAHAFEYAILPQQTDKGIQQQVLDKLDCPVILVA